MAYFHTSLILMLYAHVNCARRDFGLCSEYFLKNMGMCLNMGHGVSVRMQFDVWVDFAFTFLQNYTVK